MGGKAGRLDSYRWSSLAAWPQSRSQKEGCGFPIIRLFGLFDLATGVWIGAAIGPFPSSERKLCRKLWKLVRTGDTIVADSGFCCWFTLYLFGKKGVKVVMRNNGTRKPDPRAAKLGRGDRLERWRKSNIRLKWISSQAYSAMPNSITVRVVTVTIDPGAGFRTTEIQISCSMLDPEKMSASNIGGGLSETLECGAVHRRLENHAWNGGSQNAQSGNDPARTPCLHHCLQSPARPDEPRQVSRAHPQTQPLATSRAQRALGQTPQAAGDGPDRTGG